MRAVVVGVGDSPGPDAALDLAVEEAVRRRLPLDAVRCFELPSLGEWPPVLPPTDPEGQRHEAERTLSAALAAATDRVPGGRTVSVRASVLEGRPAEELLRFVPRAALLVVGTRGGGALRRGLRGSVSAEVLHRSWAPVLLVPASAVRVDDRAWRSRVIVGLDGSPASTAALQWAVAQAQEWGSQLVPVVVSSLTGRPPVALEGSDDLTAAVRRAVRAAGGRLRDVQPHFLEGSPSSALLSLAEPADLLVVGSHGRRGAATLLLGSTSTVVAEHAPCPVAVVREGQPRREPRQLLHSGHLTGLER